VPAFEAPITKKVGSTAAMLPAVGAAYPVDDYLGDLLLLGTVVGASTAVAVLVCRRWLSHLKRPERWVALGTLSTTVLALVHLVPGLLGFVNRAAVVVTAAGVVVLALLAGRRRAVAGETDESRADAAPDTRFSRLLGAGALVVVTGCALALEQKLLGQPPTGQDTTAFQIPTVARWLQDGSLWGWHQWVPDYSNATYPHNGNLLILAVVQPFHRPFVASLAVVPFYGLALLATYAIARELRTPTGTAMLATAAFGAISILHDVALREVMTDPHALAMLGAGGLFLLRHSRTHRRSDLVLAGVALGFAVGTKWYGPPFAIVIGGIWAVGRLRRPGRGRAVPDIIVLAALAIVGIAPWLARNWARTGNPLFPVDVEPLGITIFDAPPDRTRSLGGFTLLHYAGEPGIWRDYVVPSFGLAFGWPLAALGAGWVAGAVEAARARSGPAIAVTMAAALLALAYAATPYSALGPEGHPVNILASARYGLPALLAAAAATAFGLSRSGALRPFGELLLVAAIAAGVLHGFDDVALMSATVAILAVAGALAVRRLPRAPRRAIAGMTAAVLAPVALAGLHDRAETGSYAAVDPVYEALVQNRPSGARIGIAGTFVANGISPVLPAFGPLLDNDVERLGRFDDGYLRRFGSERAFADRVRGRRYDLILVGRRASRTSGPEDTWVRNAGYELVEASPDLLLFKRPAIARSGP
jgi:hypothetical protein